MEKRKNASFMILLIAIFFFVAAGAALILSLAFRNSTPDNTTDSSMDNSDGLEEEPEETKEPVLPEAVDFQSVVDKWVKSVGGNISTLTYDLDRQEVAASYNANENYNTASLYKLFVVYEGYKRVNSGEWNKDAWAGSTGYTVGKCLDLAIRESHSTCAETLWTMIGRNELDHIIRNKWGIVDSDIPNLISNASDIAKIMKRFYEHPDFENQEILSAMWDSFLNQPKTEYDWRQGLPSGFKKATVYNKVGWDYNPEDRYWNVYHDAAIVKFPLEDGTTRDFVVVVMTKKVDFKNIKKFGEMLENTF